MARDDTQVEVQKSYERVLSAGECLFEEGDSGGVFFVVQSGEIELSRATAEGRRVVTRVGAGEFFGEMSVVTGEPRGVRASAVSGCRLLELDGETLEDMCVERPEIAIRMIRRLSERLIEAERRLAASGGHDPTRRVVSALLAQAEPRGEGEAIVSSSLRQLARASGLSLPQTHRALLPLLERKLVRIVDDVLTASDIGELARCLSQPSEVSRG